MKHTNSLLVSLSAFALIGTFSQLKAQGPLPPPGPPAPMMKTLQEMEPRTHITALPYTITTSGSYYLATNLNGGGTAAGIIVQASGVTIDLRGFSIVNCTVGISASGSGLKNVAVHNGMVRGCTGAGIDLGAVNRCRLEDVILSDNGGDGASVGAGSIVTLCSATGNAARGLALGNGGTAFRCVAQSNSSSGIVISSNCQATENTCMGNGSGTGQAGLVSTGDGNRVEGNSANQNNGHGFKIDGTGNLVIRNNACGNVVSDYSVGVGNNYGQILLSPGAAFVNSNPWANFGCATQPAGCLTSADCNDNNPCTMDVCSASVCSNPPLPNNSPCPGGICINGTCNSIVCGNGIVEAGESCDDGNVTNGDGCTATCTVQSGWVCTGSPSVCTTVCGDGITAGAEQCDDGNVMNGDGCSATCQTENPTCTNGQTQPCYTGPPGTAGVGACQAGIQTCAGGNWGMCVGDVLPVGETCDNVDNDCDGQTDNGLGTITCGTGACQRTVNACMGGQPQNCVPGTPSVEVCDGVDNDCDGMVDESCVNTVCGNGIVEAGETCDDANLTNGDGCSASCTVQPGFSCVGSPSVCTAICGDGVVLGSEQCDDGNVVSGDGCSATCQLENPTCTNGQTRPCYSGPGGTAGVGACQAGTQTCVGGNWGACTGEVTPGAETCDNADNDCDGMTDEGLGTISCGVGACQRSVSACVGGQPQNCVPGSPSAEVCDGADNNCNGVTDEGNPGGGAACSTGLQGVCGPGTTACSGGTIVCVQNTSPSAEICDSVDNDCDGQTNEGNPGGGQACNTGQLGVCAGGTTACTGGSVTCIRNINPSAEVCGDGQDNDCNGVVDNGCGGGVCGNGVVQAGEQCDDGNTTNGDGCSATCTIQPGYACSGSPSVCQDIDECAVNNGGCSPDATCANVPGSRTCTCNAGFVGDGVTCQPIGGCTPGQICRASAGACDAAEICDGSGACPPDTFAPAGMTCRSSAGVCDQEETCTGSSTACPPDGVRPAGTVCRSSAGSCDVAETCNGSSTACPVDIPAPNNTACNDGNACTQVDVCQSGTCVGTNPITCTAPDQCHVAGVCNPANGVCSSAQRPNGTACNDGNACTNGDACQSGTCTGGNPVICTALDQCHDVGTCNPGTGVCSNPNKANGSGCSDGNACTQTDSCQAGTCVGANPVSCPVGTSCNTTTGVCQ